MRGPNSAVLSVAPAIVKTKKATGRYQLQFPRAWLQQLAGRTAEEWRKALIDAFAGADADTQHAWRVDFEDGCKASMLKRTLTVAERSGRRFDRSAYLLEAQAIYGASAIPDSATPKLLARSFQHSIDFAARCGLLGASPGMPSGVATSSLSTPAAAAPRRLELVGRSSTPDVRSPTTPTPASSAALSATDSAAPCSSQEGGELSSLLADASSSFAALDGDAIADLLACTEPDGVLLSVLSASTCDALTDGGALHSTSGDDALRASAQQRFSAQHNVAQRADEATSGTFGGASVQVGDVTSRVAALEGELATALRDLQAAREQRDVAVRESQAAAAREASVLRQLDAIRSTVKDAQFI